MTALDTLVNGSDTGMIGWVFIVLDLGIVTAGLVTILLVNELLDINDICAGVNDDRVDVVKLDMALIP